MRKISNRKNLRTNIFFIVFLSDHNLTTIPYVYAFAERFSA